MLGLIYLEGPKNPGSTGIYSPLSQPSSRRSPPPMPPNESTERRPCLAPATTCPPPSATSLSFPGRPYPAPDPPSARMLITPVWVALPWGFLTTSFPPRKISWSRAHLIHGSVLLVAHGPSPTPWSPKLDLVSSNPRFLPWGQRLELVPLNEASPGPCGAHSPHRVGGATKAPFSPFSLICGASLSL